MTRIDAHPAAGITVRHYPNFPETDVYVGGWRVGRYKTANGVLGAIDKHREAGAEAAARYEAVVSQPCPECGAPMRDHTTPHGGVYAYGADWHARNGEARPCAK